MRRIRIIWLDPDATDCSFSDEEDDDGQRSSSSRGEKPKKKCVVHQIDIEGEPQMCKKQRKSRSPYEGVRQTPSGKWAAEIRDRSTKTRIWLGTFASAEEAYQAYSAKKLELQEKAPCASASEKEKEKERDDAVSSSSSSVLATDCSSSNEEEDDGQKRRKEKTKKRIGYPIDLEDEPKICEKQRESRSPYKGVRQRQSGKWVAEIRDWSTKTRIWLGTFASAEEANQAYCAKELEFQEKAASASEKEKKDKGSDDAVSYQNSVLATRCSSSEEGGQRRRSVRTKKRTMYQIDLENDLQIRKKRRMESKSFYKGVHRRPSGKWAAVIRDQSTKTRIWLGTFASAKEAYHAYCAKELELQEKADSVPASEEDEKNDPVSSPCSVLDDGNLGVKRFWEISMEMASVIIDNNGYLLGEFSKIDDLSICDSN